MNGEPETDTSPEDRPNEVAIVSEILALLASLNPDARKRILRSVAAFYAVALLGTETPLARRPSDMGTRSGSDSRFSEDRSISPKQFMLEKLPSTDVERVACLAYYLTHYRDLPHFRTLDISKLNTEAAQVKFANASVAVENAAKRSYLVQATKGSKQLSALGEQFVQAMPDREKAKAIMAAARPRRKLRRQAEGEEDGDGSQ